mgnify:CR=1 FL=1
MRCNECGRESYSERPNFCEYCGSSFREKDLSFEHRSAEVQKPMDYEFNQGIEHKVNQRLDQGSSEKTISFKQWIVIYGILLFSLFIPMIGWVIPIVMLFVWGFANNSQPTKKNWARATLIFILAMIIISLFAFAVILSDPRFQELLNVPLSLS